MKPPCPLTKADWPPDYVSVFAWRQKQIIRLKGDESLQRSAIAYYANNPVAFICHWMDTYDPRNAGSETPARLPFVLFERQADLVQFLLAIMNGKGPGLIEKSRDMGATWLCAAFSVWAWRFVYGCSIGWGSRKESLVDKLGDPDSIFEKIRMLLRGLPTMFLPYGFDWKEHATYMRLINPQSGATITGEAGDNIGRGGRKTIYFKDESAHYERPELIEAALADNTDVQIDISSVNGLGNVFHRRREAGEVWRAGGEVLRDRANVFVMDWSEHPNKDREWYERRKRKAENDGLLHIFAQEVDRNYAAAVHGIVIPADWVVSAIDAHKTLNWDEGEMSRGKIISGLDVADEGGDKNAQSIRRGSVLLFCDDWGEGDVGQTTRRAIENLSSFRTPRDSIEFQYDSIGVGSGVKSEANRLKGESGADVSSIRFVPWNAAASPDLKDKPVIAGDKESPKHGEVYQNLKAQAWWEVRKRFERTHKAVTRGASYSIDEMISIPSDLPKLRALQKELSQPIAKQSTSTLKLVIDKIGTGARSPNLADSFIQAFWPTAKKTYTLENL